MASLDPLGDGISSVTLVNHMGDDLTVVNAARVSMSKYVTRLENRDRRLINYLAVHGHFTPFTQCQIQLRIKMPLAIARQWFKHQIGFTRNEVSRRYVSEAPEIYVPTVWRKAPTGGVKQGSGDDCNASQNYAYSAWAGLAVTKAFDQYNALIGVGVAPEQARFVLPLGTYTEFIETASLAGYARLCGLRNADDAQWETRRYAQAVAALIAPLYPVSWAALTST